MYIDLITQGLIVDIVAAGFDLGLRPADLVPAGMIAVPLGAKRSEAVVASPDFLLTHGRPNLPTDLYRFPCMRARLPIGCPRYSKWVKAIAKVSASQHRVTVTFSGLCVPDAQENVGSPLKCDDPESSANCVILERSS